MKRAILVAVLLAALAGWFLFDLGDYLTLDALKQQQAAIEQFYRDSPWVVAALFFIAYVVLTALSVPGAAIMTLAAGAIFGVATGTLIVSFASSIGATLAFLTARYLLRDAVQARFGERLRAVNDGVARDGAFYLFSLRLVPVFPFFLVNLAMGLTPIRTWTYYWVSQVGMLLGTLVYVNAGTQLARIETLSDIASPVLLASFAALGLLPWVGKWLMAALRRRRAVARWSRPARYDRNLVVIGAGAAGLVSALIGATVRASVTLVEAGKMGGDCLNTGCVPSKALIASARVAEQMRRADRYGLGAAEPVVDWRAVMRRVRATIAAIEPNDSIERYTALGVDVVQGHARIVDPWTVEIARADGDMQRLTTRSIIIAAGAEPIVPAIPGLDAADVWTSETLWDRLAACDQLPRRIVVLGGGPIGCELAQALARLGSAVVLVERAARVLGREDEDVAAVAATALTDAGVTLLCGHDLVRVESAGAAGAKRLILKGEGGERAVDCDAMLVAVGRKARLTGYGLEDLGIDTGAPLATDALLATAIPTIYAAGDVAGPFQLTHAAAHQAWFASVNALFGQLWRFKADYRHIPRTTFLDPEIAVVGLTEAEAAAAGMAVEVTRFPMHELDRAITDGATHGFVKVLTAPGKDRILGVAIVADHAGELLAEYVLAMKHGLGLNKILGTVHSYPTMAEANKFAAGVWKKAHKPERLLDWVERYHRWRRG